LPARSRRSVRRCPDRPRSAHRPRRPCRSGRAAVGPRQRAPRPRRATGARGRDIDRTAAAAPIAGYRSAGIDRDRPHQGPGPSAGDGGAIDAFSRSHRRDPAARRTILALQVAGELNEGALLGFAKAHKYEESIAALSALSGVKIATLDRLISGDRHDPILIARKAA